MSEDLLPIPTLQNPKDDLTYGKYRIAMIIDGIVHQVLVLEAADAARYLSNPTFVQIPKTRYVAPGDTFNGSSFLSKE